MPEPEVPSAEAQIAEIEKKILTEPNAIADKKNTQEVATRVELLRLQLQKEKGDAITKIRERFKQLKANIDYSIQTNGIEKSADTELVTATEKLKSELTKTDEAMEFAAPEQQKTGEGSFIDEVKADVKTTMEKMRAAKTKGEKLTIVMEAAGNFWVKMQEKLSGMGSKTLLMMAKAADFMQNPEAANVLRGLASTEKAILSGHLQESGLYVLTPDTSVDGKKKDKKAVNDLKAKFTAEKQKKTPAPAAAPAPAPAGTTAPPAAPAPAPYTFEQYTDDVVMNALGKANWATKTKREDGKLALTLSEIVAVLPS